jgi:hypothetical protein
MKKITEFILFMFYLCGLVIAKGFWSTLFAIFIFPYSWYLVLEALLIRMGLV